MLYLLFLQGLGVLIIDGLSGGCEQRTVLITQCRDISKNQTYNNEILPILPASCSGNIFLSLRLSPVYLTAEMPLLSPIMIRLRFLD